MATNVPGPGSPAARDGDRDRAGDMAAAWVQGPGPGVEPRLLQGPG